jgi:Adenosylmethionine decarboxylase
MTIHITPEPDFSYVSFESNVAASSYAELITRVIDTFKPGKFIVTVFANKTSPAFGASRELEHISSIGQFKRRDIQYCRFDAYDLTYAHYIKYPSWGLKIKPCVKAINTLSHSSSPSSTSKLTQISTSSTEDSNKLSQIPLMKFLIKLLHFFTLSGLDESPNGTQKQQQRHSAHGNTNDEVNFKQFNVLPPFAYTTAMIFFIQLVSFIFVLNVEEFSSPLVMFSYWRNKISWNWLTVVLKI